MTPIKIITRDHRYTTEPPKEGVWDNHHSSYTGVIGGKAMEHEHFCFMPMADLHVFVRVSSNGSYSYTAGCHIGEEKIIMVKRIKLDNGKTRGIRSLLEAKEIAESLYWDALKQAKCQSH